MTAGDTNKLVISGHVEHEPQLSREPDGRCVCELVLTHSYDDQDAPGELLQFYTVVINGDVAESFAATWRAGQLVVINGRLDYELRDTLAEPIPRVSIIAEQIITTHGIEQPDPSPADYELHMTAAGPIPHLLTGKEG